MYIDDGPYMPSLEHLIQHYMTFSDGLPINLRYPVPPRSKPPLPNFATIPKSTRVGLKSPSTLNLSNDVEAAAAAASRPFAKRNVSIPNDAMMMNTVGICAADEKELLPEKSTPSKSKNHDILNFRSLKIKSPRKNIIIDGMKSLKKKQTTKKVDKSSTVAEMDAKSEIPQLSLSLKNLSFSSDLKLATNSTTVPLDTLYNVPTNNTMVVSATVETIADSTNSNNNNIDSNAEYFTASDCDYFGAQDKDAEEIYFVDAPTILQQPQEVSSVAPPLPDSAPPTMHKSVVGYTAFRHVPHFPDGTPMPHANNNNSLPTFDRLDSTISLQSTASDRFFRQQSSVDNSASPRIEPTDGNSNKNPMHFIPKDNLELHEVLGEGEFGSVFRGSFRRDPLTGGSVAGGTIPVAVKTLHDEHCTQNRTEFLREASVMIKLQHHCIVNMIGISRVSYWQLLAIIGNYWKFSALYIFFVGSSFNDGAGAGSFGLNA